MKHLFSSALLITAAAQFSFATPELQLVSSGASTVTVNGTGSTVSYNNSNFNGWNVEVVFGSSNSPNLTGSNGPFGIDITALTATCNDAQCATHPLDIFMSDTGFTQKVGAGGFTISYSNTTVSGSTSESAWDDTSNMIFGQGTSIGTVAINGLGSGSMSGGGPAGPGAYSLTLEDVFNTKGATGVGFSSDGSITGVPEPVSVVLLGSVLFATGIAMRKKFARS